MDPRKSIYTAMARFTHVQHREIAIRMMVKSLGKHHTYGLDPDVIRLILVAYEVDLEQHTRMPVILTWTGRAYLNQKGLWVQATEEGNTTPCWYEVGGMKADDLEDVETLTSN